MAELRLPKNVIVGRKQAQLLIGFHSVELNEADHLHGNNADDDWEVGRARAY